MLYCVKMKNQLCVSMHFLLTFQESVCANASKHHRCSSTRLLKAFLTTCMLIRGGSKRKSSTKTDGFLTLGSVHLAT